MTGTGTMSVPLATSPGRSGFGPQLSLSYDSGSGNGPFGFGWTLGLPTITRKTDKGIPRYADDDVFLLSGAEDLVAVLEPETPREVGGVTYRVTRYLPRIEGLFARIERWTNLAEPTDVFWRTISGDNVTTWYGRDAQSRIADPADPRRIFGWMICQTHDDRGNVVAYGYRPEDSAGVSRDVAHERHRTDASRSAQRYVKHIRYGNVEPYFPPSPLSEPPDDWHFEVVFDYGEHDPDAPKPSDSGQWPVRKDAFSSYRAGFEVRTMRVCRRVLMFHHFPGEPGVERDCLVRSTDLTYSDDVIYTFLRAVTQIGYRRDGDGYAQRSLPPVEFEYTQPVVQDVVEEVDTRNVENLPMGLDGSQYRWTDLHGEGIPGILTEQAGAWFYKRNLSPMKPTAASFAPTETVARKPNAALAAGADLMDLAGDGLPDVVIMSGATPGLYEHDEAEGWQPLRPFTSVLTRDRDLRFIDLDGDGRADVLAPENEGFVWHPSLAEEGFGRASRVTFTEDTQSLHLADLSGDGLTDLVRIRNGEVCYWPNLGYGRFGAKVTMDNAPLFDHPDQFDHEHIRLADIDGSGTTDIIYLHRDGVRLYFNESGNGWSQPRVLKAFPRIDDTARVAPVDLLGNGTTCLVWSSPSPGDGRRPLRYVNLMGRKPHLLIKTTNNLGAETRVEYAPSTKFYLLDKRAGKPWVTRLPFPTHLIERVETYDHLSRNRFVTTYAYHHGHFDGEEREFRGFGMVEQWDTEQFEALVSADDSADNVDAASHVPPVRTKTWFHTGADLPPTDDYFGEPDLLLADTVLPQGLTAQEEREACRALKGSMLRQELYADDGGPRAQVPYSVVEQNLTVRVVQPLGSNRHAVFFTHPRETISYHYERNPEDPRVQHALILEVDQYGNALKSVDISYGRRAVDDPKLAKQAETSIVYSENRVTNAIELPDTHRKPLSCETRTFELTGYTPTGAGGRFQASDLVEPETLQHRFAEPEVAYEATASGATRRRPIEWLRTLFRRDDLTDLLPLGEVEPLGLPGESYKLAFTPGLLAQVYADKVPDPAALLGDVGGFVQADGGWWLPSGRSFYSTDPDDPPNNELAQARSGFFQARRHRDPFGNNAFVDFDDYTLMMAETRDAVGNRVTVEAADYRVVQPTVVSDANRNRTQIIFDVLGLVAGSAVMGKLGEGDSLNGFVADLTQAQIDGFLGAVDPHTEAAALLKDATSRVIYDLDRFRLTGQPACAVTLGRETHASAPLPAHGLRIQLSLSYSDGFGREIQRKAQAEAGPLDVHDPNAPVVDPRWVGSGWTVFNNKGSPVRQFEPFFSATHGFEFGVVAGVGSIMFYDPTGRVVVTLHPNDTYEKVLFDAWRQTAFDVNDTCTIDPRVDPDIAGFVAEYFKAQPAPWQTWHAQRIGGALGTDEQAAAQRAEAHANTPSTAHFDALGRPFLTVVRNRVVCPGHDHDGREEEFATRVELDIEGNQREVRDAADRIVVRYAHDMLGNRIHQRSMEAGARWTLGDVEGASIRAWDDRGHLFTTVYDALRRPVSQTVRGTTADSDPRTLNQDIMFERTEYGEGLPNAEDLNLRGRIHRGHDPVGVATNDLYDFKGNLLRSTRRLVLDHTSLPDWGADPALDDETFVTANKYDAMSRPVQTIAPHSSLDRAPRHVIQPVFNAANLLERMDVWLERQSEPDSPLDPAAEAPSQAGVANIDYDAKGQRLSVGYKNGALTSYTYDPLTFRLTRLVTRREGTPLQDLSYTYDAAGNITHIQDQAQQDVFFRNRRVEPSNDYFYDAGYRLIQATGREHLGLLESAVEHPGDGNAMATYVERFVYDAVGNLLHMRHKGDDPSQAGWTRAYDYLEPSQLDALVRSNRLSRTRLDPDNVEPYEHDAHGNMVRLPNVGLRWDYRDRLRQSDLGGGGTAFYQYDGAGTRVRKVWEKAPGLIEERIYLGGFEIFRKHTGEGMRLERETLHVRDDASTIALVETRTLDTQGEDAAPRQVIRYQFGNHLGSACLELDAHAQIVSYEEYTPYGSTSYRAVRAHTETPKRYRFAGKERDDETGLYHMGARYYASWLGRWISADPAGLVDGSNLFVYGRANPVTFKDPSGTQCDPSVACCPELMGGWDYNDPVPNRSSVGQNVQKDHPIQVSLRKDQTRGAYNRNVSKKGGERTVLVETGKGKFHTELGKYQREINSRVRAGIIKTESALIEATREAYRLAAQTTGATVNPQALDQAIVSNLATLSQESAKTAARLRAAGVNASHFPTDAAFDAAFADPNPQCFAQPQASTKAGNATGLSPVDADVDARTGQVVDGPNTKAALARREARVAANTAASESKTAVAAEAKTVVAETKPAVSAETKALLTNTTRREAGIIAKMGGGPGVVVKGLWVANIVFAVLDYREGTRPNTPAPMGDGMIGGSTGEGILNFVGSLLGGPGTGTILRQSAEFGSAADPKKVYEAVKQGSASPVSIGMGIAFGSFR